MKYIVLASALLAFAANAGELNHNQFGMTDEAHALVQFVQDALDEGMLIQEIVADTIGIDPQRVPQVLAAVYVISPKLTGEIVSAAIGAGGDPLDVVSASLIARRGLEIELILSSAIAASPEKREQILEVAVKTVVRFGIDPEVIEASFPALTVADQPIEPEEQPVDISPDNPEVGKADKTSRELPGDSNSEMIRKQARLEQLKRQLAAVQKVLSEAESADSSTESAITDAEAVLDGLPDAISDNDNKFD